MVHVHAAAERSTSDVARRAMTRIRPLPNLVVFIPAFTNFRTEMFVSFRGLLSSVLSIPSATCALCIQIMIIERAIEPDTTLAGDVVLRRR